MAFSRKSTLAAVAGSLSLAMLTGCPAPNATPSPSPTATAPTSPSPTGQPSAEPTTPGETPTTTPSATPLEDTTLRGTVYDADTARVNSAKVTVKSLNPSSPFESTVDVINGTYVVNSVPAGVQLEITATRDGWTSRSRVETLLPLTASDEPNIVNFGGVGGSSSADAEGAAYFISKYPEIVSVEPAEGATNVDPTKLTVTLTLSEALDTTNQRRFENALRVLPANEAAAPELAEKDVVDLEDATSSAVVPSTYVASGAYEIKKNSQFLDETNALASVSWDADGKVATLSFDAPLISNKDEAAKYQIALVSLGSSQVIEDKNGDDLGVYDGKFGGYSSQNADAVFIQGVFKEADLALTGSPTTAVARWLATHTVASTFEVAEDDTAPTLTGVDVVELASSTRITFTFNEPMAAFGGNTVGYYGSDFIASGAITTTNLGADGGATDLVLQNFTFAVAETQAKLDDVELDGVANADSHVAGTALTNKRETEFYFKPATDATIDFEVNPNDAKQLRMIINKKGVFDTDLNAIKARVENVADPAGNKITERSADQNVQTGTI